MFFVDCSFVDENYDLQCKELMQAELGELLEHVWNDARPDDGLPNAILSIPAEPGGLEMDKGLNQLVRSILRVLAMEITSPFLEKHEQNLYMMDAEVPEPVNFWLRTLELVNRHGPMRCRYCGRMMAEMRNDQL